MRERLLDWFFFSIEVGRVQIMPSAFLIGIVGGSLLGWLLR